MQKIKDSKIAIIGLGYVDLPFAVEFSKRYSTVGFDINKSRVNELNHSSDSTFEVDYKSLKSALDNGSYYYLTKNIVITTRNLTD